MNILRTLLTCLCALLMTSSATAAEDVITAQPEGRVTYYDRLAYGWYIYAGGNNLQYGTIPGSSKIVWADDGTVYIQDPLTANKMGTYIKARHEGDKIIADFPQVLGTLEDNFGKRPLYIGLMKKLVGESGITYLPIEDKEHDHVSWTIHQDGTITMDHAEVPLNESGNFIDVEHQPDSVMGTYYYGTDDLTGEYGGIWNAVADWAQTYTPIQTGEILTIPENLKKEIWRMTTKADTRMVEVAFDGNDVYLGNITQYVPGAIKGTLKGGKKNRRIEFPTGQYIGFNEEHNANAWFLSATAVYVDYFGTGRLYLSEFKRTDALVFDYDETAKTMTCATNDCYLVNASQTETNHFEYVVDPCIKYLPTEDMNAAPKNPVILNPGEDQGNDGLLFSVEIPAQNINGVDLNIDQMYYNIYLNGELWTFHQALYPHFSQPQTDVPYSFNDKYDLQLRGAVHDFYLHEMGIKTIGIVSCFRGSDGVVYKSDLITARVPGIEDEPDTPLQPIAEVELAQVPAARTTFAYAERDAETEPAGTGMAETYNVAIALTNPSLVGKMVTSIAIPVVPSTKVSGLTAWITPRLRTELVDGRNVNVAAKSWPLEMPKTGADIEWVTLKLDKACVIPEGGLYVGYSLTVDEIDLSIGAQVPIVTSKVAKPGSFYIRTSRVFLDWADRSEMLNISSMLQVELAGELLVNAATVGDIATRYLALGKEQTLKVPVYNIGKEPITSLQYRTTLGSDAHTGSLTFPQPIPAVYAYCEQVQLDVPAPTAKGDCKVSVEITGVNGQDNDATEMRRAEATATVVSFVPRKLPLVEEFTGTWCGWCPRGFVAMEKMNELYPDDFIGIAYHDKDPMAMKEDYPLLSSGFPNAAVNRVLNTDPYLATGQQDVFSMPQLWESYCADFSPVGISVEAELGTDSLVTVRSDVQWVIPCEDPASDYRVEYVLVADDVYGDNSFAWLQKNYFATEARMLDYMEQFWHQPQYIVGLHFNDVAILTSGTKGVPGSVTTTDVDTPNAYTYQFDARKALNADGTLIPFHHDRLRVIAFLLRGEGYGEVVNAAKCNVTFDSDAWNAIAAPEATKSPAATYNLQGQKVARGYKGIVIKDGRKTLQR